MTTRWVLTDPATDETWTMPINPDQMTSPHPAPKRLRTQYGIRRGVHRIRTFMSAPTANDWEWQGVIRTEEHYDALVAWAQKPNEVHVTDHLGRTWEVLISQFQPTDRKPTVNVPWRLRYRMRALVLRKVS